MYVEQPVQILASLIDETKVEETMVYTTLVGDVIHRAFRRAISLTIPDVKSWGLDGSCYFYELISLR